jgi:hypothetical protein
MAMKKTFGGDSPLRQGVRKSFWTLRSWVDDGGRSRCVSRKLIGCLGFSRRGVFIGEGAASEVDQGASPIGAWARGWLHRPMVWPAHGPPLSPLWTSGSFNKY